MDQTDLDMIVALHVGLPNTASTFVRNRIFPRLGRVANEGRRAG